MINEIRRACVIGAGTMGAGIAALLANAGISVDLLDVPAGSLTPDEEAQSLSLSDPAVRSRLAIAGLERARRAKPAAFASDEAVQLVRPGNTEDDLGRVAEADWIVEAILEQREAKQALMARIEAAGLKPGAVVSTNTSGIPIGSIAEGRSPEFQARFLGTHFFNPPRYLKLLEIIPAASTAPDVVEFMTRFGEDTLGKGVVLCKDTPNFIANRLGAIWSSFALDYALTHGYTVEEVDSLTGELIGRPKTATFRLFDLVGLDVAIAVRRNLYDMIPDDEAREVLHSPRMFRLISIMLERGWLGNKTGQGFYKPVTVDGGRQFWTLNLDTLEYEPPQKPRFASAEAAQGIEPLAERLKLLLAAADRAGDLIRAYTYFNLAYASHRVPEIADDLRSIDKAVRWGFMHQAGPFEIWNLLGVAETVARMEAEGYEVARWVRGKVELGVRS